MEAVEALDRLLICLKDTNQDMLGDLTDHINSTWSDNELTDELLDHILTATDNDEYLESVRGGLSG